MRPLSFVMAQAAMLADGTHGLMDPEGPARYAGSDQGNLDPGYQGPRPRVNDYQPDEPEFDWCAVDHPGHFADCNGCRHDRPPATAELSKRRSMERKWRKAAAKYPESPAAVAIYQF